MFNNIKEVCEINIEIDSADVEVWMADLLPNKKHGLLDLILTNSEQGWTIPQGRNHVKKGKANAKKSSLQVRRDRIEIKMRDLDVNDRKLIFEAKKKELETFLQYKAIKMLSRQGISKNKLVPMRWVLTWKESEDDGVKKKKGKARLVAIGYKDPDSSTARVEAPTQSRVARNVQLQVARGLDHDLVKGDISGAFLQGEKDRGRHLYGIPPKDVLKILNVPEGYVMEFLKQIYGLTTAPRGFFLKVVKDLKWLRWENNELDQCTWILRDHDGSIIATCGMHVDDFIFTGKLNDPRFNKALAEIKETFTFGEWKINDFRQCGCDIYKNKNGDYHMNQKEFCNEMKEIEVPLHRRRSQQKQDVTEEERTELRGRLGELQWLQNTRADVCASCSIMQGGVNKAQVKDLMQVNSLIRGVKNDNDQEIVFRKMDLDNLLIVTYTDAAWGVREDGSSQGGYITVAVDKYKAEAGQRVPFSILDYGSKKLKRVVKSSLAAEVQAFAEGLDQQMVVRHMVSSLLGKHQQGRRQGVELSDYVDNIVKKVPAAVVTDAKSLYDGVEKRESFSAGLQDRRSGIEVVAIRQQVRDQVVKVCWTNSDQQIADGLTKMAARLRLVEWLRAGHLCLQHDPEFPEFTSAKKIRQAHRLAQEGEGAPTWRRPKINEDTVVQMTNRRNQIIQERDEILANLGP